MIRLANLTAWLAVLIGLTEAERSSRSFQLSCNDSSSVVNLERPIPLVDRDFHDDSIDVYKRADIEAVWTKAVCNGQKIFQAMKVDAEKAGAFITPVRQ
jgi:hypothetical protein